MLRDLTSADLQPPGDAGMKKCEVSPEKITGNQKTVENGQPDNEKKQKAKIICYHIVTVVTAMFTILTALNAIYGKSYCTSSNFAFNFLIGMGGAVAMMLFVTGFMWILPKASRFLVYRIFLYIVSGIIFLWLCGGTYIIGNLYLVDKCNRDNTVSNAAFALVLCWTGFLTMIYPLLTIETAYSTDEIKFISS